MSRDKRGFFDRQQGNWGGGWSGRYRQRGSKAQQRNRACLLEFGSIGLRRRARSLLSTIERSSSTRISRPCVVELFDSRIEGKGGEFAPSTRWSGLRRFNPACLVRVRNWPNIGNGRLRLSKMAGHRGGGGGGVSIQRFQSYGCFVSRSVGCGQVGN